MIITIIIIIIIIPIIVSIGSGIRSTQASEERLAA